MKVIIKISIILLIIGTSLLANAIATVTALKGDVKIENVNVTMEATLGAKLEEADTIITAQKSKAQIIFNDDTIVTIGKESYFSIQKYVDDMKNPEVEFHLLKGVMRTITGKIGKIAPSKFKVHTKTATIGIRGTNFIVIATEEGAKAVYCTYGAISVSYQNVTHTVKQGFFANISLDGKVKIQKFSAEDLQVLEAKNFGVKKSVTTKGNDGSNVKADDLINPNEDKMDNAVVLEVSDDVKDALFTQDTTEKTIYTQREGWSIDKDMATLMSANTNLAFTEDGNSFDTVNSYIKVLEQDNLEGTQDNWSFYLQESPNSFDSIQNFTTAFGSVSVNPLDGSTSKNPIIINTDNNKFTTFEEPIGDYMSWGEWSVEVQYEYDDQYEEPYATSDSETASNTQTTSKFFEGLWITGEITDPAVIANLDTSVQYLGTYKALDLTDGRVDDGHASLFVDFGKGVANLIIEQSENGVVPTDYSYKNLEVSDHGISGENANGSFYGPNAESVGGNFKIDDSSNNTHVKGVYQTTQTEKMR